MFKRALLILLIFPVIVLAKPIKDITPYDIDAHIVSSIDIVSNYVWRGLSQTDNGPAVQAGVTYTFDSGIYAYVWGSPVNFPVGNKTSTTEIDTAIGYKNSFYKDWNYNLNIYRYNYPKVNNINFNEYIAILNYKILTATLAFSDNEYGSDHAGFYSELDELYTLPESFIKWSGVSIGASAGYWKMNKRAGNSYFNYKFTLGKQITKKVALNVSFTGTNGAAHAYPYDRNQLFADLNFTS